MEKNEIYRILNEEDGFELEDNVPIFDADIDVVQLLHDATTLGLDEDGNEIPGYVFASTLADMLAMSEEGLVEFAQEHDYIIYEAQVVGEELPSKFEIICAKGCKQEFIKDEYKELFDLELELTLIRSEQETEDDIELEEGSTKDNVLKKRAKKHKKTDRKGARGWFVNPDAGNVEKNIAFFNHAMGNSSAEGEGGSVGVGLGEDLEIEEEDLEQYYYNKMIETGACDFATIEYEHEKIIQKIIIPRSIKRIEDFAFADCESLTSITIPNSVEYIGYNAFYECESLESITLPKSVEEIKEYAFEYCLNLKSVTLPNSVKGIGYRAFRGCESLKDVYIVGKTSSGEQERVKRLLRRAVEDLNKVTLHFENLPVSENLEKKNERNEENEETVLYRVGEGLTSDIVEAFKDDAEFFDEFSDFETYMELSEDSSAFKVVDNIIEELGAHKIDLSLDYVVEARNKETDKTHYIATFNAGLNGEGEWSDYLEELEILFDKLDCWLISLENDVLDDRFTLKMGFNINKSADSDDLEEEFELTEVLPTKNETKEEFVARFMKDTEEEYPNPKQRYAVALKYWEKK